MGSVCVRVCVCVSVVRQRKRDRDGGLGRALTHIDDPLLGGGLPGMPVLPEAQLLHRALLVVEDHHHHTLQAQQSL